jgi:hypothetical protein
MTHLSAGARERDPHPAEITAQVMRKTPTPTVFRSHAEPKVRIHLPPAASLQTRGPTRDIRVTPELEAAPLLSAELVSSFGLDPEGLAVVSPDIGGPAGNRGGEKFEALDAIFPPEREASPVVSPRARHPKPPVGKN